MSSDPIHEPEPAGAAEPGATGVGSESARRVVRRRPPALDGTDDEPGWDVDGFTAFIQRNRHRLLDAEEERALGHRVQHGPSRDAARWDLVRHNLLLVAAEARRQSARRTPALDVEDLFQEGLFGLIRAVEKFDPDRGNKFSTYAVWWIRQAVSRGLDNRGRTIRLPSHTAARVRTVQRARVAAQEAGTAEPTPVAIAARLGWPADRVAAHLRVGAPIASLDELDPTERDRAAPVGDAADETTDDPAALVVARDLGATLDRALATLSARERDVLVHRMGLGGRTPLTLQVIADRYGVTRERIRQIEVKALERLREPEVLAVLDPYVDAAGLTGRSDAAEPGDASTEPAPTPKGVDSTSISSRAATPPNRRPHTAAATHPTLAEPAA